MHKVIFCLFVFFISTFLVFTLVHANGVQQTETGKKKEKLLSAEEIEATERRVAQLREEIESLKRVPDSEDSNATRNKLRELEVYIDAIPDRDVWFKISREELIKNDKASILEREQDIRVYSQRLDALRKEERLLNERMVAMGPQESFKKEMDEMYRIQRDIRFVEEMKERAEVALNGLGGLREAKRDHESALMDVKQRLALRKQKEVATQSEVASTQTNTGEQVAPSEPIGAISPNACDELEKKMLAEHQKINKRIYTLSGRVLAGESPPGSYDDELKRDDHKSRAVYWLWLMLHKANHPDDSSLTQGPGEKCEDSMKLYPSLNVFIPGLCKITEKKCQAISDHFEGFLASGEKFYNKYVKAPDKQHSK
ncbi:MAG TPA: hypothetical protein VJB34_09050 [Bdellovibrionota bacterium]|nr:hypothetical protein [Bdellovibrionota bacterium]